MTERVGVVAAAAALEKSRKTLARWRARGAPFGADGLVDVEELRAWAASAGLLGRTQQDGRPPEVERLAAGAAEQRPAPAPAPASQGPATLRELSPDDRAAIEVLGSGDAQRLLELAATHDLELAKRLAAWGRARAENAEAERRELEVRAQRRDLLPKDEVLSTWRAQVGVVSGGFLSLPGKVATALAQAGLQVDLGVLISTLERELHELLDRFAATTPGEAEGAR